MQCFFTSQISNVFTPSLDGSSQFEQKLQWKQAHRGLIKEEAYGATLIERDTHSTIIYKLMCHSSCLDCELGEGSKARSVQTVGRIITPYLVTAWKRRVLHFEVASFCADCGCRRGCALGLTSRGPNSLGRKRRKRRKRRNRKMMGKKASKRSARACLPRTLGNSMGWVREQKGSASAVWSLSLRQCVCVCVCV